MRATIKRRPMKSTTERLAQILDLAPVVPVVTFDTVEDAVFAARALVAGGLPVIEITLRSAAALDCIAAVAKQVEGAIVGAGTVLSPQMMQDVGECGAEFAVSPGSTQELIEHARKSDVPLLPGVSTASEAMALMNEGFSFLKFFPAEQSGGAATLKHFGAVFPKLRFCPTGGLNADNAGGYLGLANVVCVGGSWVVPKAAIAKQDGEAITRLAAEAALLAG